MEHTIQHTNETKALIMEFDWKHDYMFAYDY